MFRLIFILMVVVPAVHAESLYVSPSGDDSSGDGTSASPWQSVSTARDAVRAMIATGLTENVTVYLREGVYEQSSVLTFDSRDAASANFTVTYASADGAGSAVLKSASVITNSSAWSFVTNGIWEIYVGSGLDIDTLYENGVRADEARYPNRGANRLYPQARAPYLVSVDGGITISNTNRSWVTYSSDDFSVDPARAGRITIFPYANCDWHVWTCDVSSVETNANRINFKNFGDQTTIGGLARYFVSGSTDYLDAPGEFVYDEDSGYLYYKPRAAGNPAYLDISVPVLKTLVEIEGSNSADVVSGLIFDGLVFSDTAAVVPSRQWWTFDWGLSDYGVVRMQNTSEITFKNCHIKNSGRHGILAVGQHDELRVESCCVENIGVSGIVLCNRYAGASDRIRDCIITNCVVRNVGNLSLYAGCVELMSTESCVVDQCEFYDSGRYAVTLRGNCKMDTGGFTSMPRSTGNIVRNCWIERCMQDGGDGGPLHEAGINDGTRSYVNYFENIFIYNTRAVLGMNDPSQIAGIHLDWGGATLLQSFSNVWVEAGDGPDFKHNNNPTQSFYNVSWVSGFDSTAMDMDSIGLATPLAAGICGDDSDERPAYKDLIVDNTDDQFTEVGTGWGNSNLGRKKLYWEWQDAPKSRLCLNTMTTNYASWAPDIDAAGYYDVYVWKFQEYIGSTTGVVYTVVSADGTSSYTVNQQSDGMHWQQLGTHYFESGSDGYVLLDVDSAESGAQVRADAVRFAAVMSGEEVLWRDAFDVGYISTNLIGQNGWAVWSGESPDVTTNAVGWGLQGVTTDDARAKKTLGVMPGTNRFVSVQFSGAIPDTASLTASQVHVGLGAFFANSVGLNLGLNAAGVFLATNGISMSGFAYGYIDGALFVPESETVYIIKMEVNLLEGTARLFVSTDGLNYQPLAFNAAGTDMTRPVDALQSSAWDAVYLRMGRHAESRVFDITVEN